MLWPFNHFRSARPSPRATIEPIYGTIVAQTRDPLFYKHLEVPDTVDGRFDLLILHLWLVLRRLRKVTRGVELSQALFDHFCNDMDANLREMGVGDLAVPRRMRAFGEAFYGRTAAYDLAWEAGEGQLAEALQKNIFSGRQSEGARRLASYAGSVAASLDALDETSLLQAAWAFPTPLDQDVNA